MSYYNTTDERYGSGYFSFDAGYLDAPDYLNEQFVIAPGDVAFGAVMDLTIGTDQDVYSFGILTAGIYRISVENNTWDFTNFDYAGLNSFSIVDSEGFFIETKYYSGYIDLTVLENESIYVVIEGNYYADAQYSVSYVRIGDPIIETDIITSESYTLLPTQENLAFTGSADVSGTGNELDNIILGNPGENQLRGEGGNDWIEGGAGTDAIYGGDGNDRLNGGTGADRMIGGDGNDVFVIDGRGERAIERLGGGIDLVMSKSRHVLTAHVENLTLTGGAPVAGYGNSAANVLQGNSAANVLDGRAGADRLVGRAGGDKLIGGAGADTLYGGRGADIFVFRSAYETGMGSERDRIGDFSKIDQIDLRWIDANENRIGNQKFSFIGGRSFSDTAGELHYQSKILSGDTDGDGISDFEIAVLAGVPHASDFFL